MHKSKFYLPALMLVSLTFACAAGATKEQADAAIKEAKAAYTRVAATGFAWTETSEMIEAAEKAMAAGNADEAVKFAQRAKERSQLAYEQYEANKDADMIK
jgi:hypothetical protein